MRIHSATAIAFCMAAVCSAADLEPRTVTTTAGLKAALSALAPGTVIRIAPGEYGPGNYVRNVSNLTIEALDPASPPVFKGGKEAWHFTRCDGLTLRNLAITGQSSNGINIDDGGRLDSPVAGITLQGLRISNIGPTGNHDAIKLSGLHGFTIRDCHIEGWAGQAIDMVGCHSSLIMDCRIIGKEGWSQATGIQTKGGSSGITIEKCRFIHAGPRPLNIGGSTGMAYFRPPGAKYEAKDITVRDCVIEGGSCAASFVGVDGATFTGNTILFPEKWIFRILQETKADGFAPCRNVTISGNRIVFRRSGVKTEINIGPDTGAESFSFSRNRWFAEDAPDRSRPNLPSVEEQGEYGTDPRKP
ncbi:right-handed parallel beta-helix repeat-containing protein [Luteolibacter sp. SL250]|uniref:right-handed parallel beta-helix repeat-containing protein n=1 Tax=Luteolibacter sp. SL250 TaxID=2995170 RepID=UPI002271ADD6|nr:right-handed parallel beta-helix repeat-containing protein [Luteolibacter sp. SL250]WAC18398.1 right-handed parallel beta-helix repeat-containing protein [Luteolibacter sp. SL250]